MKKIQAFLAFVITLYVAQPATAQEGEPVLANVIYEVIHVADTNHRENPTREEMVLCLGQNSSKYANNILESRQLKSRRAYQAYLATQAAKGAGSSGPVKAVQGKPIAVVYGPGITQETLFQHPKENKLNKVDVIGLTIYLIESPLPKIDWKIEKETRKIGDYTCQKAVGDYAGRTYTAWFTPDLPFQNGPWKLSGLPGLILEAKDSKNEVSFLFKEINRDTALQNTGMVAPKLVKTNEKAFERVREAWLNDPIGIAKSQMPGNVTDQIPLGFVDSTGKFYMDEKANTLFEKYKKETLPSYNNPIELIKR